MEKKNRRSLKQTALFLCFALLFPLCAIGSLGLELPEPKERPVIPYALRDCEETETFLKRLPGEEQGLDTIVFLAEGGQRAMYLFAEPVKYLDENGETVDKDLTLVKTDGGYTAKANDIALLLPDALSDGISLSYNGNGFALRPAEGGEESIAELTKENTVLYSGAFGAETALRYTPAFSGFKEDILLYRNVGKSSFSFTLSSDTLVPFTDEAGVLFFCDRETGEPLFRADDIVCYDAKGCCFTGALTAEPTEDENTFLLTVSVDPAILDDPDLTYPVTVDPSIGLYASASGKRLYDATICTNSAYCSGTGSILTTNTYSPNRYTLFSFPVLYNALSFMNSAGFTITNASLHLRCVDKSTNFTGITAHCYTGSFWTESNVPTSTSYYSSPYGSAYISDAGSNITLNVTALFQSSNMDVRKGILIKPSAISSGYASFYSTESTSNRPYFYLHYSTPQCADIPTGEHSYVIQNEDSENFAYIPNTPNSYPHLKQADPDTVKEGGKDFDSVLFTIRYDSDYGCYFISNYRTENVLVCRNEYGDEYYLGEYYNYMYGDSEAGWYIRKTNDGYFQFIPCETILFEPQMMSVGANLFDGSDIVVDEYDVSSSTGNWSLYLSANVKNMEQKQTNYCSVTSTVQLLYAAGQQGVIETIRSLHSNAIDKDDEDVIGIHYGLYSNNNGGDSSVVLYFLQEYISSLSYVSYCWFTNSSAETWIFQSFCKSAAVMVYSHNTEVFSYYENNHYEHFFMIAGIDIVHRNNLLVNDCNLFSDFNGIHFITSSELVNMDGYSCIYVSPDSN